MSTTIRKIMHIARHSGLREEADGSVIALRTEKNRRLEYLILPKYHKNLSVENSVKFGSCVQIGESTLTEIRAMLVLLLHVIKTF